MAAKNPSASIDTDDPDKGSIVERGHLIRLYEGGIVIALVIVAFLSVTLLGSPLGMFDWPLALRFAYCFGIPIVLSIFIFQAILRVPGKTILFSEKGISKEAGWNLDWKDLKTVGMTKICVVLKSQSDELFEIPVRPGPDRDLLIVAIGRHLPETQETEISRPVNPRDIDGKARLRILKLLVGSILTTVIGWSFVMATAQFADASIFHQLFFAILLCFLMAAPCITIVSMIDLLRIRKIAKNPDLADPNRELERTFYDQYGDNAEYAARFWRHVWSNNKNGIASILPKSTKD